MEAVLSCCGNHSRVVRTQGRGRKKDLNSVGRSLLLHHLSQSAIGGNPPGEDDPLNRARQWRSGFRIRFSSRPCPYNGGRVPISLHSVPISVCHGDGGVDVIDFLTLLGSWGLPKADVDGDGDSDLQDLLDLLSAWGPCP